MQPRLFDWPSPARTASRPPTGRLDGESETVLARYRASRLRGGAHQRTVAREVSQLRGLVRGAPGPMGGLRGLFADARTVARALLEPAAPIAASTGRSRLVAAQRFVRECGREVGVADAGAFLADLDSHLPTGMAGEWHALGIVVAGGRARRRPLGPTLSPADLGRIVDSVDAPHGYRRLRDRALVALHCCSGLRPEEIAGLRLSDIVVGDGESIFVERRRAGRWLRLPVPDRAGGPVLALRRVRVEAGGAPDACLFGRGPASRDAPTLRAVRSVVQRACAGAGFPLASAVDLRAAFAYGLRLGGLSDHEVARVLGLQRVRSLDRLLARHRALDAQRRVREVLPA